MTVTQVLAVCGLTAAVSWAGAQPQTPSKTDPAAPASSAPKTDEASLLKRMEGRWKVDVAIDPSMWNQHVFKDEAPTGNDATKPGKRPSDSRDPATSREPPTRNPDGAASADLARTITGYSNVKLILGEHVLQETIVLPDMKAKMDRGAAGDDKQPRTTGKTPGDEKFKGVSIFSFDENNKTYSMVFVDNCQGGMRYCTGAYDARANRLVFTSADEGSGVDPSARSGGSGPSDHQGKRPGSSGMRVVVEFVSADEHLVTMYALGTPMGSDPGRANPASGKPADPAKDDDAPGTKTRNPSTTDRLAGMSIGKVVYRAVYHRAAGDEIEKSREAFRVSDAADK